jgi:hypothetical protein
LILGSFAIANHERTFEVNSDWRCALAALAACACYIGLGFYGARLDGHVSAQCDKWRKAIAKIAAGSQVAEVDLVFEHWPRTAYLRGNSADFGCVYRDHLSFLRGNYFSSEKLATVSNSALDLLSQQA